MQPEAPLQPVMDINPPTVTGTPAPTLAASPATPAATQQTSSAIPQSFAVHEEPKNDDETTVPRNLSPSGSAPSRAQSPQPKVAVPKTIPQLRQEKSSVPVGIIAVTVLVMTFLAGLTIAVYMKSQ